MNIPDYSDNIRLMRSSFHYCQQLIRCNQWLLARSHILQSQFPFVHFISPTMATKESACHWHIPSVSSFSSIRINFGTYPCFTDFCQDRQTISSFFITEVYKQQFSSVHRFFRVQIQLIQHIKIRSAPKEIPTPDIPSIPKTPVRLS